MTQNDMIGQSHFSGFGLTPLNKEFVVFNFN